MPKLKIILLLIMRGHIYIYMYISTFVCPVVDATLLHVFTLWLGIFH